MQKNQDGRPAGRPGEMNDVKLIHCADVHLDSSLGSHLSQEKARERNQEIKETFERMVDWAGEQGVTGILIAGDLFDTNRVTAYTADYLFDVMRSAPEIDFFLLRGNHDADLFLLDAGGTPENLKCFGDEWTTFRCGDAVITGAAVTERNAISLYDDLRLDPHDLNVVVMHGQIASSPGPDRICLPSLAGKNIDYLALGHYHSYRTERLDGRGEAVYSGCLEGRGFDECGEKGFVLITAENGLVRHSFVPFCRRKWEEIRVDVTGLVSFLSIRELVEKTAGETAPDSIVRIVLCGKTTPDSQIETDFLERKLNERFYHAEVLDETTLVAAEEDYSGDVSLKGTFIRLVLASDELSDEEKRKVIAAGIRALRGEEIVW